MKTIKQLEEKIEALRASLEINTKDSKYYRTKSGALKRRIEELEKYEKEKEERKWSGFVGIAENLILMM